MCETIGWFIWECCCKKIELQQRFKKIRLFNCPQTFFTWAGIDFPLHDYDKKEDEEKKEEEEDEEDEEKEEDEEEVTVTNRYE